MRDDGKSGGEIIKNYDGIGKITKKNYNSIDGSHKILKYISTFIISRMNSSVDYDKYPANEHIISTIIRVLSDHVPDHAAAHAAARYHYNVLMCAFEFINKMYSHDYKIPEDDKYIYPETFDFAAISYDPSSETILYDLVRHFETFKSSTNSLVEVTGGFLKQYHTNKNNYSNLRQISK